MQTWTRFTTGPLAAPTVARTKDGTLHIVWAAGLELMHATPAGKPNPIVTAWTPPVRPKLAALPDGGLRAFFGGEKTLNTAMSKDVGVTWGIDSSPLDAPDFGIATDREGKPYVAFTADGKLKLQSDVGAKAKVDTVREGPCCISGVQIALDGESTEGWAAWRQSGTKATGIYSKAVKPSTGTPQLAPGSGLVAPAFVLSPRVGQLGVYAAYCVGPEVKLWNTRGGEAFTVARVPGARNVFITPGHEGRLWILWIGATGAISGVRSNKALSQFSKPYAFGHPAGAAPIRYLIAEGSTGPLAILADGWHTRLDLELDVRTTPEGVRVSDFGDPVEGAEVEVEGKKIKTDPKGLAAHKIAAGSSSVVKATHPAYGTPAIVEKTK
jgi:hypothetical protein